MTLFGGQPRLASEADLRACAAAIRHGSKSFHAASLLLPRRAREPILALYAFCRSADDAIDAPDARRGAIEELRRRLDHAARGAPRDHPIDRAFADALRRFSIPRALPEALLEGLAWDAAGNCVYRDLAELESYGARVAGAVGVMVCLAMGERRPRVLARAAEMGVAMQLTNIARDIGEDARAGRLYLPRDWLASEGIEPDAFLARPRFSPALGRVTERLLARAETLYAESAPAIGALPVRGRPALFAAARIYREIGRTVAANGFDGVSSRAATSTRRKLGLAARALFDAASPGAIDDRPPLAAVAFLLDPIEPAPETRHARWWRIGDQIGRAAELMAEFEARQHRYGR